ncbi:FUSC family protein [Paraburkholderia youngii]|uniref:FUSC family protein n=1 Tax=Paraburkholderia youngii TaxID=2782701 RepID=UPI003D212437
MSVADYIPDGLRRLVRFLRDEIRAYPGRANVMLRCVLASALVITASVALQVPFLAVSLIVVFYVTQSNVVMTRLIGVLFMLGSTLAVGSAILVIKFTYDFPLLRILLAAALFFASVYMMRVAKIGVVFFLVALVVIYVQTFVDLTDQPEVLVRIALWVWVATNYPIVVTLLINTLLLPAEPVRQLESTMLGQLKALDACLADVERGAPAADAPRARDIQSGMLALQKLLRFSTMRDAGYRRRRAFHLARVTTVSRLYAAAGQLRNMATGLPDGSASALREACDELGRSIRSGERFVVPDALNGTADLALPGPLEEMRNGLNAFAHRSAAPESMESKEEKERLLVPDASTNPVYAQFALKTLLAVMIGYVLYIGCDWQGIHTVMLTCLIVAQPSLGATAQRSLLRIGGAAVGSGIALAMVVWVVPHIDDIVGLLMISLPVMALGAWVAAGSERISYAGVQIMFTFALSLLEHFGPTTDLTEIRDRMIGIVLGVGISTIVHATLWPEAEGEALRQRLARLLHGLAGRLRGLGADEPAPVALWVELGDCEAVAARVAVEPGWRMAEGQSEGFTMHVQTMLAQTREILLAVDALEAERRAQAREGVAPEASAWREAVGASLDAYAVDLTEHAHAVRSPAAVSLDALVTQLAPNAAQSPSDTARLAHQRLLDRARNLAYQVSRLPAWGTARADMPLTIEVSQA